MSSRAVSGIEIQDLTTEPVCSAQSGCTALSHPAYAIPLVSAAPDPSRTRSLLTRLRHLPSLLIILRCAPITIIIVCRSYCLPCFCLEPPHRLILLPPSISILCHYQTPSVRKFYITPLNKNMSYRSSVERPLPISILQCHSHDQGRTVHSPPLASLHLICPSSRFATRRTM